MAATSSARPANVLTPLTRKGEELLDAGYVFYDAASGRLLNTLTGQEAAEPNEMILRFMKHGLGCVEPSEERGSSTTTKPFSLRAPDGACKLSAWRGLDEEVRVLEDYTRFAEERAWSTLATKQTAYKHQSLELPVP